MIVNWVKEDEELLEPYEWSNGSASRNGNDLLFCAAGDGNPERFLR